MQGAGPAQRAVEGVQRAVVGAQRAVVGAQRAVVVPIVGSMIIARQTLK